MLKLHKDLPKARPAPAFDSLLSAATMCAKGNASPTAHGCRLRRPAASRTALISLGL